MSDADLEMGVCPWAKSWTGSANERRAWLVKRGLYGRFKELRTIARMKWDRGIYPDKYYADGRAALETVAEWIDAGRQMRASK